MHDVVRQARQELIEAGLLGHTRVRGVVPDLILRSWRRSISNCVDSASVCRRYQDVDPESALSRAARPVLDRWQEQLADTGTTLFLSDRAGRIVARRTSDSSVRRRLDRVHAAEGFDYSEGSIGTNGLGTSMVEKRAVLIEGPQHYNDALGALACAAVPVYTPAGAVAGSVSLGGPLESANPLMLTLTREIGQQIEERLRAASRPQDLALAMSFLRYTNSQRPTVVMDRESLLANTPGLPYVSVDSHVVLWELLNAHDWSAGGTARFRLDGTDTEVMARRVLDGPQAHFVLHFAERDPGAPVVAAATPPVRSSGDGLLVVDGPRGSGRATLARELRADRGRGRHLEVVMAGTGTSWSAIAGHLEGGTDVLLRRAEDIPSGEASRLVELAEQHRAGVAGGRRTTLLMLTLDGERVPAPVRKLAGEPAARTQPLARTPERIPGLVKRILDRVDPDRRHTVSPAALQAFMQWSWPGNIAELADTVAALVRDVPGSVIQVRHLPPHLRQAPPRRPLTLIEAAEREAIIKALDAAGGNKSEAAELLGIGRTTLYRRLRQLRLDGAEGSL
ncbi:sigma-54-dependent Fis family transcriptional regulator [Amycolatopsis thermoflava]|uniref:sigma-54-dependent Fis family transcriptional regulator n=1 Tax=Amycolatopsis thermoflava TaxID=84480 RepID=UPI0036497922